MDRIFDISIYALSLEYNPNSVIAFSEYSKGCGKLNEFAAALFNLSF